MPSFVRFFGRDRLGSSGRVCGFVLVAAVGGGVLFQSNVGCQQDLQQADAAIVAYEERLAEDAAVEPVPGPRARLVMQEYEFEKPPVIEPAEGLTDLPPRRALLAMPEARELPEIASILSEIPDPIAAEAVLKQRLEVIREEAIEDRVVAAYERVLDVALGYLRDIDRSNDYPLTLEEAIQRALEHNYTIRASSYKPAIEGTRLVEAQAAFDAEFFLDGSVRYQDRASLPIDRPSIGDQTTTRSISGGIRKLLPSGMVAEVSSSLNRVVIHDDAVPPRTNPLYTSLLTASVRQPLLRGFGIEVNRAQIEIARANRDVSYWQFARDVRDQLLDVETAYWRLVQARRRVVVLAESIAQNKVTFEGLVQRMELDATPVEIENSRARFNSRFVQLQDSIKTLRDAEDTLKFLINDPELLLSDNIEIIPTSIPLALPVTVDQFREVRTALDGRSEIKEARQAIDAAQISTFVAKNQLLPQLDLSFQYSVEGLGNNADASFDEATGGDFASYSVGVSFSYPIGNRAPEAAHRRARLEERRLVVLLKQVIDSVVQEVNTSVRNILLRYAQLGPQFEAVQASERNLRSLQARAQEISPAFLETELSAVEQLADNRLTLLGVLLDYNLALARLERDKGTLLEYNNVALADEPRLP